MRQGCVHCEDWWCKKSATSPALRSILPTDKAFETNVKLSHHVAIMWKNCVIGNPPQLNLCEYRWERNEGEKPLRPTMLPTGIKIAPDEILQTIRSKCVSSRCNKNKCRCVRAGLDCSEFCDGQQNSAMIKLTCTWMIMKLRKNNDSESSTEND